MKTKNTLCLAVFAVGVTVTTVSPAFAGTGVGQSIRTGNGSPDGVIRTDRALGESSKAVGESFEGVVPAALQRLGLQ